MSPLEFPCKRCAASLKTFQGSPRFLFNSFFKLCIGALMLGGTGLVLAQKVSAPAAIDGVTIFAPAADTTIYGNNASSGTVEDAAVPGQPVPTWCGLWCYSTRHAELTFSPGTSAVSNATLYLYNYYYEGFTDPGTGENVTGTATVYGIGGLAFSEPAAGYKVATTQATLLATDTSWAVQGAFTMAGSDGSSTTPGSEVGWYAVDVTDLWNANLGGEITLSVRFAAAAGADGPIFEDKEGNAYSHGCYGAIPASGPRIQTIASSNALPAVNSFSLMYSGTTGAVPGYDPLTNGALINLFITGTNLNVRANTSPSTDFGSVVFNLTGATTQTLTDNVPPWALFGDTGASYNAGYFNSGAHTLTATPYIMDGGTGSNGLALTISFTVTNSPVVSNSPPSVSLDSPAGGALFAAPANITLQAAVSDIAGTVTNVQFYSASTMIGQANAPPFSFFWTNVAVGAYALTAKATDNLGNSGSSAVVNISVLSTKIGGEPWVFPGATWDESKTPEDFGMITANLTAFRNSLTNGSSGGSGVVIKNGYLVYKWGTDTQVIDWTSASKPCVATMLFSAINEGKVASVDSLVWPYTTNWSGGLIGKDRAITFRHLADMTSGWCQTNYPGTSWGYSDPGIMLFVRTMDVVFGGNGALPSGSLTALVNAANTRFVVPLQFEQGSLFTSSQCRVNASARDYARMGWFWLNRGNWSGTQLLPEIFFDNYMKADVPYQSTNCIRSGSPDTPWTQNDYLGIGSYGGGINDDFYMHGTYGFNWWFNTLLGTNVLGYPAAPADTFLANGHDGEQCMAIVPSLGLVVAAWGTAGSGTCWGTEAPSYACAEGGTNQMTSGCSPLASCPTGPDPVAPMNLSLQLLLQALPTPSFASQPQSLTNAPGTVATFSAGAVGTLPLAYQWQFNGSNIASAVNSSLSLTNVQSTNAGSYTLVVTNALGTVTSQVAVLTVLTPPTILGQQYLDGSFKLNFSGPAGQTYRILTSTNVAGPISTWIVLANGTFPFLGTFTDSSASNDSVRFYLIASP